jgi:hypothetical protein
MNSAIMLRLVKTISAITVLRYQRGGYCRCRAKLCTCTMAVINLSTLTFTENADTVPALGLAAITNTGTANTLDGDDKITGTGGFSNSGTIDTGTGNDTIKGISNDSNVSGIRILSGGRIKTGTGNDTIEAVNTSSGGSALILDNSIGNSTIDTGSGRDIIKGIASGVGNGISLGTVFIAGATAIYTGSENDEITGIGSTGIYLNPNCLIDTGSENDKITGIGTDYGIVIRSGGKIVTGAGNDSITGSGGVGISMDVDFQTLPGLPSIIDTGGGNDIVDASVGGFYKHPSNPNPFNILLGDGNDVIKGFGSVTLVDGGNNYDKCVLPTGSYTVGRSGSNVSFKNSGGVIMNTTNFEQLIAGVGTYNFANLYDGLVITVS